MCEARQCGQTCAPSPITPRCRSRRFGLSSPAVTWLRAVAGHERRASKEQRSVRAIDPLKVPQHDARSSRQLGSSSGGETTVNLVASAGRAIVSWWKRLESDW